MRKLLLFTWLCIAQMAAGQRTGRSKGCMGAKDVMKEWPDGKGPTLEYEIELEAGVAIGILPTQDVLPARGLRLGVQIDNQLMQIIDARHQRYSYFGAGYQ